MKSNMIIISLLILIIFTMGAVSAVDENISNPTCEVLSVTPADSLESDESDGTFSDLGNLIENTSSGDTLYLEKDYMNDGSISKGIDIINAITIDGQNHTINSNKASNIFNVKNDNVILKNINFINGINSTVNGTCTVSNCHFENCDGNAILFSDSIGNIYNCSFINCYAKYGSTINCPGSKGNIYNCSFVDCYGASSGGIKRGYAYDCSFINCSSSRSGGALYKSNAYNCSFIDCTAMEGGAVYACTNLIDCSFVNCSATNLGGAVFYYGTIKINNCSFVDCYAKNDGGAIYGTSALKNCSFINCSAGNNGGAYWGYKEIKNARDCSFVNCTAGKYGGALYMSNAYNCSFIDCTADKNAAAIYNGNATNCNITNWYTPGGSAINNGNAYNSTVLESPHIIISTDFASPNESFNIFVTLSKNAAGNVKITVNGTTYKGKINSGKANATFDGLDAGNYEIIASYAGNSKCCAQTVSSNLLVGKIYQGLNVSASEETYFGESTLISIETANDATGYVHVLIEGKDYKAKINKGNAILNVSGVKVGVHNITAKYNGNYKYAFEEATTSFKVLKGTPITSISANEIIYGDDATIAVEFSSYVKGYVKILVDNKVIRTQITNNTAYASFSGLKAGIYNVSAIYAGNSNYNTQTYTTQLTVNKATPITSISHQVFNNGEMVTITVKLNKNVNGNVRITFNGTTYVCKIENGVASLNVSNLGGRYTISARYAGNANFEAQSMQYTFKVYNHLSPNLSLSYNVISGGLVQFEVSIASDAPGNVKLTVDGKYYKTPITSGAAYLMMELSKGQHSVKVQYGGNYKYDEETITEKITV